MTIENSSDAIDATIASFQKRFKGNSNPVTMEMAADIWAEFLVVQTLMMDVAKLYSSHLSPTEKNKIYLNYANGLQKSFDHIRKSVDAIDSKGVTG